MQRLVRSGAAALLFLLFALSDAFVHKKFNTPSVAGNRRFARMMRMDYYTDLGVTRSADDREIKSAFRKKARECHPDVNDSPEATEQFQKIQRAYEILGDPEKRARYDQFGEAAFEGGGGYGGGVNVDLSDIFDSFFGGNVGGGMGGGAGGRRRAANGPIAGDDLRVDLTVDFKTAVFGGEESVQIRHTETCDTCGGSGAKAGSGPTTCGTCGGTGMVTQVSRTPFGAMQMQTLCPACGGSGEIIAEPCPSCGGQGVQEKSKSVKVNIPCGVSPGNKLRVKGEGDAGRRGGPAGDLYIYLDVRPDARFERDGRDVSSVQRISYIDAILGRQIGVDTVDGKVDIDVPAGTQPGTRLRIRGRGAPALGREQDRGDHYVLVKVEIPNRLSNDEKKLLRKLADLRGDKA